MSNQVDVVIVDCGLGNAGSIHNMLKRIGVAAIRSMDPVEVRNAPRIILPGVGAFDAGMARLQKAGLVETLTELATRRRVPVFGICLGMQLMARRSEEGQVPGLGWIEADVRRFKFDGIGAPALKVPHMGWNSVTARYPTPLLLEGNEARFYFVHSYHVCCSRAEDVLATTTYGVTFTSMLRLGNIVGAQFHPEKSHQFGLALLENWLRSTIPGPAT